MKFIKQKGQTVVEFALVLPVFCFLLFGIFYATMFAVDYVTLNNIAYNMVHKAVINSNIPDGSHPLNYDNNDDKKILFLDKWYSTKCNLKTDTNTKIITIETTIITESEFLKELLPNTYTISSSMYYNNGSS